MQAKVWRKTRKRWNFLQWQLSIYRGEGGSSANTPRFDRCEIFEGRVSTLTFRGWHFFTEILRFSWNRIVEVNPLPRGASVGEFRKKPVTLEMSRFIKFVRWVFRNIEFAKISNLEPAKLRSRELAKIWNLEPAKLRSRELAKICNLEPAKLRSRELAKIWNLEPAKICNLEPANLRSREDPKSWTYKIMKSGISWRSNSEVTAREDFLSWEIHESVRSKVKDVISKSPGSVCELVAVL
jgi:hypothetical protein